MVISRIIGGLGNQMFQYAIGFHLAKKLQTEFKLDTTGFDTYPLHRLSIGKLTISAKIASKQEISKFTKTFSPSITSTFRQLFKLPAAPKSPGYIHELKFTFNPEILELTGDLIYLDGYWQSEKYFNNVDSDTRREFQIASVPDRKNQEKLALIQSKESVCVHIRRGDYVKNQETNSVHGTAPLEYYYQALEHIQTMHRNPELFIFSDDLKWVRQNLHTNFPMHFMDHNGPEKDYEDLRLMSTCKHHIIANSTFSWWGAWLGEHPGQIVIAPKKWFRTKDMDSKDLIPSRWLQL